MNLTSILTSQVYIDNICKKDKTFFIDYTEQDTMEEYPKGLILIDKDLSIVAILNIEEDLIPKIPQKGVYQITDQLTKELISIQLYKSAPYIHIT